MRETTVYERPTRSTTTTWWITALLYTRVAVEYNNCMPNQQLVDYIKGEVQKGVAKEAAKKALVGAGWKEGDVDEALKAVEATPAATVSSPVVSPVATPAAVSQLTAPFAAEPFKVSEIIFKPEPATPVKGGAPAGGEADSFEIAGQSALAVGQPKKDMMLKVIAGALAVLVVAFAAGGVYIYLQSRDLQANATRLTQENSSLSSQLSALSKEKSDLDVKVASLSADLSDLNEQVLIFAAPAAPAKEVSVAVRGTLRASSDGKFTLVTSRNIVFTVKNYKDAKVTAALKPLADQGVTLSGVHAPASLEITVQGVNGSPL